MTIRPVDYPVSQQFGENPTKYLPADDWLIQTFGNYQPDGHSGEDYSCPVGTPVRAVTSGTVLHVGWMGGSYADNPWWIAPNFAGYCAVIDHGAFIGIYGHCKDGSATVAAGERVSEGQVFILSGNTGGSTGPHLHFEILPDRYILQSAYYGRVNPANYVTSTVTAQSVTAGPQTTTPSEEANLGDKMLVLATDGASPQVWVGDGVLRRPVWTLDTMSAQQWLASNKVLGPFYRDGAVQTIPDLNSIGIDVMALVGKTVEGK